MLGIFFNKTDSDIKYYINLNNYNILKKYFNKIIIIDIDSQYSLKLKKVTNIQILPNTYNILDYKSIIKNLDINIYSDYKNIVFINDNNIYLNNFDDYFNYINDIDICSYCDLYENDIFSIKVSSLSLNNPYKLPFLKMSYLNINDERIYKYLIENNILSLISLEKLLFYKKTSHYKQYKHIFHKDIPEDFDINIYRSHNDLKKFSDDFLYKHFIEYGQYELRRYNNDNHKYILPFFIREKLKICNLLHFYDVPDII